MTGGNNDGVDHGIADQAVFVGGTVMKSELLRSVMSMGAIGGTHADQPHATDSSYRRQQCAGGEVTSSEQSDSNRIRGCHNGCSTLPSHFYGYAPGFLCKLWRSNQDSQKGLLRLTRD